jgi:hypothetical protein
LISEDPELLNDLRSGASDDALRQKILAKLKERIANLKDEDQETVAEH